MQDSFLKVFKSVGLVVIPFGVCLCLLSSEFIRVVYGDKWVQSIAILNILAWGGIFTTLPAGVVSLFLAKGKSQYGFFILLIEVVTFFTIFFLLVPKLGAQGVAIAVSLSSCVYCLISIALAKRLLKLKLLVITSYLKSAVLGTLLMAASIFCVKSFLIWSKFNLGKFNLFPLALVAVLTYSATLFLCERDFIAQLKRGLFTKKTVVSETV